MTAPGQLAGQYNIVKAGEYETFEHQMPVREFLQRLKNDDVPDKVSIVGLEKAFDDEEFVTELAREMDQRADDLEYQSPTIQFVVEGSFHRQGKTYDLRYGGELYPLQEIFGPQLERRGQGDWITSPF